MCGLMAALAQEEDYCATQPPSMFQAAPRTCSARRPKPPVIFMPGGGCALPGLQSRPEVIFCGLQPAQII